MTERMVSVPVEPTEDAYTLAARLAPDLFSDDYETAHRAASPYDVTIKRRHKAEEVQIVIDLYRAMLTAAPVREEGGAEDEGRLFAEVPLGAAALYRDLENGIRPILATREEAPAEAGEAARIIACHLPLADAPDTVCLPITMTAGDLRTVYAALRALASGTGDHAGLRRLADEAADFGVPAQVDPAVLNALLAENAALNDYGRSVAKEALGYRARATEAERKLAEAVRLLRRIDRTYADMQDGNGNHPTELRKVRTFLSKEAERG